MITLETVLADEQLRRRVIQKMVDSLQNGKKVARKEIMKYLQTFSFEIGCELPTEKTLRQITDLLQNNANQENQEKIKSQGANVERVHVLVDVCLRLYMESQTVPIGGIFERVVINLRQSLANKEDHTTDD